MPRTRRSYVLITLALAAAMAFTAGPPAQAREAAGVFDTLSIHLTSWMAAWWPWSAAEKSAPAAAGHVVAPRGGSAVGVQPGVVGSGSGKGVVVNVCIDPTQDPNGCPG